MCGCVHVVRCVCMCVRCVHVFRCVGVCAFSDWYRHMKTHRGQDIIMGEE